MSDMSLFGPESALDDFTDLVRSRSGSDVEPENFWKTFTFVLITIAVDC